MAAENQPSETLRHAIAYPYEAPLHSYVQTGAATREVRAPDLDLREREPLLTYGSNAAPTVLAQKLAALPEVPLPVLRAELTGFDVVYSAHVSPYGAVPATLQRSEGTTAPVFVAYPTAAQRELLTATEPNYELRELSGVELRPTEAEPLSAIHAYVSRHGCLNLDEGEVALAAVESAERRFRAMGEVEVLERVRHLLAPDMDLERFVESGLDPGMATARTTVLRGNAIAFELP